MTSANAGTGGQASTSSQQTGQAPQANNSGSPSAAPQGQAPEGNTSAQQLSLADYERIIADLRKENAGHRTEKTQIATELQKFRDAQLSDAEKAQKRTADLEKANSAYERELNELKLTRAIERKAAALNIINPEVAARLLDWSTVEFDDSGAPKNLDKLLAALIQAEPYLVAAAANGQGQPQSPQARPASSGGATNPGAGGVQPGAAGGSGATITRTSYLAMSVNERITRMKEIDAVLARNGGRLPD